MLTKHEREKLERRANKYTLPDFIVARAKMMLLAERGLSNDEIANSLSTCREIVSRWRKRFFEKRLGGREPSISFLQAFEAGAAGKSIPARPSFSPVK